MTMLGNGWLGGRALSQGEPRMQISSTRAWLIVALAAMCCPRGQLPSHVAIGPAELPSESFEKPPELPYDPSSYAISLQQMSSFFDVPGEYGNALAGRDYGFQESWRGSRPTSR